MIHQCCIRGGRGRKERQRMWWRIDKKKEMVYDKAVYERCCVTKKDGVRVCVTKLCVEDGVCESCVWKRACEILCVKDGVWQSCVWMSGSNVGKKTSERGGTRRRQATHIMGLFARSNRLCSNLHTQVSHANVTSIATCPTSPKILTLPPNVSTVSPNRNDLTASHGRSYCACMKPFGNLTWPCTKNSQNLLRNLLRNLAEPDLALHQSLPDLLRNLLQNPIEPDPGTFSGTFSGTLLNLTWHCTTASQTFSGTFSGILLNLTWLCTKAFQSFSGSLFGTLLNLTRLCTKASRNLLRNLLRNPIEPDLASHQSLPEPSPEPSLEPRPSPEPFSEPCWTRPGFAPKPPRSSPEPSPEPRWTWSGSAPKPPRPSAEPSPEPCWTWPGSALKPPRPAPEPFLEPSGTLWNLTWLSTKASQTCSGTFGTFSGTSLNLHQCTPELYWAEDPISLRCWGIKGPNTVTPHVKPSACYEMKVMTWDGGRRWWLDGKENPCHPLAMRGLEPTATLTCRSPSKPWQYSHLWPTRCCQDRVKGALVYCFIEFQLVLRQATVFLVERDPCFHQLLDEVPGSALRRLHLQLEACHFSVSQ